MDQQKKIIDSREKIKQQSSSTGQLLKLIDKNEQIFRSLKSHLMEQLIAYQTAFSRQNNKYTQERDFDHFEKYSREFSKKGREFIDRLAEIKSNCTTVIKYLPDEQRLIPTQSSSSFDMFVNEQVDKTLQYKMREIEYEADAQRPFENQLEEFQAND